MYFVNLGNRNRYPAKRRDFVYFRDIASSGGRGLSIFGFRLVDLGHGEADFVIDRRALVSSGRKLNHALSIDYRKPEL